MRERAPESRETGCSWTMRLLTSIVVMLFAVPAVAQSTGETPPAPSPAPSTPTTPTPPAPPTPAPPSVPTVPAAPAMPATPPPTDPTAAAATSPPTPDASASETSPEEGDNDEDNDEDKDKAKKHQPGDFDAGGQARFPSGPDEMGKYAAFHFVAADVKGTYYLLPTVMIHGFLPLAIIHPDQIMLGGASLSPRMIGGMRIELDASIPKLPKMPGLKYDTSVGLQLGMAYMREGALLLSAQDFPLFTGDFQPGVTAGLLMKIKLSNVVDFHLNPLVLYQKGSVENLDAVQIPLSLVVQAGSLAKLGLDLAVNTGDNYSFSGDSGGRIAVGASLELKIGKLVFHAGGGLASLLSGGMYPGVIDSLFVDVNARYAK